MAHSRTSKKNIRKSEKRRLHNRGLNAAMRTEIKKVRTALESGDVEGAKAGFPRAQKLLDKAAKTNRMHPNKAARTKSRLARDIAKAAAS
ncbi:MAG: 30S ribosomal protein S20 [Planctomycetota bacterium]|jgi:small subunit ribosomal protein S20